MPKTPTDYSKTLIYKIINVNPDLKDCYVGHTTNFVKRKNYHKNDCMREGHKNYNYPLYKHIRENGGWENFAMIEIEKFPCSDLYEALARERHHYEILRPNLNGVHPGRDKKECDKIYSQTHKDDIREKHREYAKMNSDHIKEYQRRYRAEHREQINKYHKEYIKTKKSSKKSIESDEESD